MWRICSLLVAMFVAGAVIWHLLSEPTSDAADESSGWDLTPPIANATPVTAAERLPGIYPAGSQLKDEKALGGFGGCDNWPKKLNDKDWGAKGAISLVAFPNEAVAYFKHR